MNLSSKGDISPIKKQDNLEKTDEEGKSRHPSKSTHGDDKHPITKMIKSNTKHINTIEIRPPVSSLVKDPHHEIGLTQPFCNEKGEFKPLNLQIPRYGSQKSASSIKDSNPTHHPYHGLRLQKTKPVSSAASISPFPLAVPGEVDKPVLPAASLTSLTLTATSRLDKPISSSSVKSSSSYQSHFTKGSLIQLANGVMKKVEELKTDDFRRSAESSEEITLDPSVLVRLEPDLVSGEGALTFSVGSKKVKVKVSAGLEHPFFVFGRGWSSCSPRLSMERYNLECKQLVLGDVCISLTDSPKYGPGSSGTSPWSPFSTTTISSQSTPSDSSLVFHTTSSSEGTTTTHPSSVSQRTSQNPAFSSSS